MDIIDELFELIKDEIEFNLSMYKNLISRGKIYIFEKKILKKSIIESIDDEEKWIQKVNRFLNKIDKEGYEPSEIKDLYDTLKRVYKEGIKKVNKVDKSEIESVSISGNNFIINEILNKILNFRESVIECYIPTLEGFQKDINEYLLEGHTEETWIKMNESLEEYKSSLWIAEDKFDKIYEKYIHDFKN